MDTEEENPLVIQNNDPGAKHKKSKQYEHDDLGEHVRIHLLALEPTKFLWYYKLRFRVHLLFHHNNKYSKWIEATILSVIIINVVGFILNTDQDIAKGWVQTLLNVIEYVSIGFFTLEYLLRLWSVADRKKYRNKAWLGRLRFLFSPFSLIDLASIIPFYIALAVDFDRLEFSTALRIFRVFRLLKAEKYNRSFSIIGKAIYDQKDILLSTLFICLVIMILQATALYFSMYKFDPVHFGSIPKTLWYSVMMVTGVGGYETVPLNTWAKVIAGFTAFIAVAMFAVPVGVVANGFVQAFESEAEIFVECPKCNHLFKHTHKLHPEIL